MSRVGFEQEDSKNNGGVAPIFLDRLLNITWKSACIENIWCFRMGACYLNVWGAVHSLISSFEYKLCSNNSELHTGGCIHYALMQSGNCTECTCAHRPDFR